VPTISVVAGSVRLGLLLLLLRGLIAGRVVDLGDAAKVLEGLHQHQLRLVAPPDVFSVILQHTSHIIQGNKQTSGVFTRLTMITAMWEESAGRIFRKLWLSASWGESRRLTLRLQDHTRDIKTRIRA
jgi:hypothetical protein